MIRALLCKLFGHRMTGGHIDQCRRCFGVRVNPYVVEGK